MKIKHAIYEKELRWNVILHSHLIFETNPDIFYFFGSSFNKGNAIKTEMKQNVLFIFYQLLFDFINVTQKKSPSICMKIDKHVTVYWQRPRCIHYTCVAVYVSVYVSVYVLIENHWFLSLRDTMQSMTHQAPRFLLLCYLICIYTRAHTHTHARAGADQSRAEQEK